MYTFNSIGDSKVVELRDGSVAVVFCVDREAVRRRIDEIDAQISAIRALGGD